MIKVAMIGAGSVVFSKNLTVDLLSYPEFRNILIHYTDIDSQRLEVGAALCRKAAAALGASPQIHATVDRREALRGADFVINMIQVGGFDSTLIDFEICRKYGLNFTIADTTGPGGLFRALRTYPVLASLCREMEEICPRAWLLNYANPMSMNMQTITRTSGVQAVGLCHSVQGTLNELAGYLGERAEEITFLCAGINHMAFYLRLEKSGQDLYPRLFAAADDSAIYNTNKVRFELMKRLGYFVTESSEHNAEYNPWFLAHGDYHAARYSVPIDEYLRRCECIVEEFARLKSIAAGDEGVECRRSREYGSTIVHSIATNTPAVVYGNMPNRGAISNLAPTAIAEAPTLVDRSGLRLALVGDLPPQLIGYIQPHVTQHELFIRAAMEGRRDHLYQALMFDPLTAAQLTLDQTIDLCDELIAAHGCVAGGGVLPDLDAKKTLSSVGGRGFETARPAELRKQRQAVVSRSLEEYLRDWHVIGPFTGKEGLRPLRHVTPLEAQCLRDGGSPNLHQSWPDSRGSVSWIRARADSRGLVDLGAVIGRYDYAIAYGYAQVHSDSRRQVVLRCGSDDGIKVWINGKEVHGLEVGRAYVPDSDLIAATLSPGINRIFVKIDNLTGGWGFALAVPRGEPKGPAGLPRGNSTLAGGAASSP